MANHHILQSAEKHLREVISPQIDDWEASTSYPRAAAQLAAQDGLLGMYCPPELGGQGLSFGEAIPVYEILGKGAGLYSFSLSMHNIVAFAISGFGTDSFKKEWVPKLTSGEALGGFVLTEPQSGSDAAGLRTHAEKNDDGSYTVTGHKAWVSLAAEADLFLVVVKTSDEPGYKDIAMVGIPADSPGLSFGPAYEKLVSPFMPVADMHLNNVRVPAENVILPPGQGLSGSLMAIDIARTSIAAGCCGLMEAALDSGLAYAKSRQLFGKSELKLQGIQWMLADIATDLEASRLLYQKAAPLLGTPEGTLAAAHAKRFVPDAAQRAAATSMQVLGAYGLLKPYAVERLYRIAPVMKIVDGTTEIQRVVIARELQKRAENLPGLPIPRFKAPGR
jgi:hypothetical protein